MGSGKVYKYEVEADNLKEHFDLIDIGQLDRAKPVLVIYNPQSGQRVNLRDKIKAGVERAGAKCEIYETTGYMDAFEQARKFDIDAYSALGSVGGDGTHFEVFNGMLKRKDKKKIPLWLIPNGTGNAICKNFNIKSIDDAIRAINKGDVVNADVVKCLFDYESEEAMRMANGDPEKHLVYAMCGCFYGMGGLLVSSVTPFWKNLLGPLAYLLKMAWEFYKETSFKFDLELDGKHTIKGVSTPSLNCTNIKYEIGDGIVTPTTLANDGIMEMRYAGT